MSVVSQARPMGVFVELTRSHDRGCALACIPPRMPAVSFPSPNAMAPSSSASVANASDTSEAEDDFSELWRMVLDVPHSNAVSSSSPPQSSPSTDEGMGALLDSILVTLNEADGEHVSATVCPDFLKN